MACNQLSLPLRLSFSSLSLSLSLSLSRFLSLSKQKIAFYWISICPSAPADKFCSSDVSSAGGEEEIKIQTTAQQEPKQSLFSWLPLKMVWNSLFVTVCNICLQYLWTLQTNFPTMQQSVSIFLKSSANLQKWQQCHPIGFQWDSSSCVVHQRGVVMTINEITWELSSWRFTLSSYTVILEIFVND